MKKVNLIYWYDHIKFWFVKSLVFCTVLCGIQNGLVFLTLYFTTLRIIDEGAVYGICIVCSVGSEYMYYWRGWHYVGYMFLASMSMHSGSENGMD